MNHAKKLERIREANAIGTETCRSLNNRELLLAGACLYWGEGSKSGQLSIVNSDPQLLIFFMRWLQQCFGVNAEDFMPRIYINEVHESRLATVRAYWSETLGIPEQRFRTTILVRTKQKKIYENHDRHYGQVTIRVRNSTDIRYKILGLIYGLKNSSLGV